MPHKDLKVRKEYKKNYYDINKERLSKSMKEYRNDPEHKIQAKEYFKIYYNERRNDFLEYKKQWYKENKERLKEPKSQYYLDNREYFINLQKDRSKIPENKIKRRKYIREYDKMKKINDYQYLIRRRLQSALRGAMRKYSRTGKIMSSTNGIDYKSIIEKLGPCPSDNQKEWHIDHIIPQVIFDFNDKEQIKLCYSPDNLRWYPAKDNLSKWARIEE